MDVRFTHLGPQPHCGPHSKTTSIGSTSLKWENRSIGKFCNKKKNANEKYNTTPKPNLCGQKGGAKK